MQALIKVQSEYVMNLMPVGHDKNFSLSHLDLLDHHPYGDGEGDYAEEDGEEGEERGAASVVSLIAHLAGGDAPLRVHLVLVDKGAPGRG